MRTPYVAPAGAIALVLGLLSSPAQAVQFTHPPPYTLQYDHPLVLTVPPTPYVIGDAKAVVLGQLDADKIPDACVLHGTEAHFIRSVDRRNRWKKLSGSYSGLAKLPQAQANGGDGVLTLDSSGLVKLLWDSGVGNFAAYPISGTSAWIGSKELQVVVAPSGAIQILAMSSDGRYILRALFLPATGALSSLASVPVSKFSTAMVGVDFSPSTDLEYAVAGSWGIEVLSYTTGANQLAYVAQACNRSLLKRIPIDNQQDRIAWVRAPTGTEDDLSVLLPSGSLETAIHLLGASIAQWTLSDLGEDARKELLLFADGTTFMIGMRRGTTTTFKDFSDLPFIYDIDKGYTIVGRLDDYPFVSGTGVLGGANKAPVPQCMDLDGDGDEDLFAAGHPGGAARAMIFLGRIVDEENTGLGSNDQVRSWLPDYACTTYQATNQAQIQFSLPGLPTAGPASAATHLKITVWTQAQNAIYMDPASEQVRLVDLTPSSPTPPAPIVIGSLSGLGNGQIHLEFSYLDMNGATMEAAFPAYHERLELSWFTFGQPLTFYNGEAGHFGMPGTGFDGGIGGTSGRPPITPPSGGGG